jgi:hypothetical protein
MYWARETDVKISKNFRAIVVDIPNEYTSDIVSDLRIPMTQFMIEPGGDPAKIWEAASKRHVETDAMEDKLIVYELVKDYLPIWLELTL